MAEFRVICRTADVADGASRAFPVGDKLVAVFHRGEQYFAIDDVCPHMGASLSEGDVEDGVVACSWHGWRFRLADGVWADSPRVKIGCYPVRVVGDEVQIEWPS